MPATDWNDISVKTESFSSCYPTIHTHLLTYAGPVRRLVGMNGKINSF